MIKLIAILTVMAICPVSALAAQVKAQHAGQNVCGLASLDQKKPVISPVDQKGKTGTSNIAQ